MPDVSERGLFAFYQIIFMYFNGNQVDHFLKELGLMHQVGSGIFIDGRKLADLMKIELPKTILAKPKLPKPDKVWSSLVLD